MVLHSRSKQDNEYFLDRLGVNWYLTTLTDPTLVPTGAHRMVFIRIPTDAVMWNSDQADDIEFLTPAEIEDLGFPPPNELSQLAATNPGAYWYFYGEFNRLGYVTGARFAPVFHYLATKIRESDATAKILGPSILNWDFTCIGCTGYGRGDQWLDSFIGTYEERYGFKPPVDVWSINTYPIDWVSTPNNDPEQLATYGQDQVLHSEIVTRQLVRMRDYLDAIPQYFGTPIWITEIALHVGYSGWSYDPFPKLKPVGAYHWDKMSSYLAEILDWLEENAAENGIDKWFFYISWTDIVNVGSDGYMGMTFFDGRYLGAPLNCLGEVYRGRALGEGRWKCDDNGNKVPE